MRYNWGTPLECLSMSLLGSILVYDTESAYRTARSLYRRFMRINPHYWE